jgi:hypothetical protein
VESLRHSADLQPFLKNHVAKFCLVEAVCGLLELLGFVTRSITAKIHDERVSSHKKMGGFKQELMCPWSVLLGTVVAGDGVIGVC